jgi:hypothetical protein
MKWLAVGTGRCGTKSLVAWANENGSPALHESVRLPFNPEGTVGGTVARRLAQDPAEVSFMWTAHALLAREMDPELPIICMHRDKFDTVASHVRICGGKDRLTGRMTGAFNNAYPQLKDKRDSWLAWGFWYDLCEELMDAIPQPVWHMDIEDLNEPGEMTKLATWLSEQDRW